MLNQRIHYVYAYHLGMLHPRAFRQSLNHERRIFAFVDVE